jgi:hypothetical protein
MTDKNRPSILSTGHEFTTIFGRNLIAEIPAIAHRPSLVVTVQDLWEKFSHLFDGNLAGPYFAHTIDGETVSGRIFMRVGLSASRLTATFSRSGCRGW